ncbi:MAG: SDR family NAD(P)-dependent oxidoreductase [Pseudolysinimonas sp.]
MTQTRDRVVVILGASSGIGRATALEFAAAGTRLVLAARSLSSLRDVAAECEQKGAETLVVVTDVTPEAQLASLVDATVERFGRIDVWVGVAGVFGWGTVDTMPAQAFDRIIEVNLLGQVRGVRAVLPQLTEQRSGTIVLLGSVYSRVASPYLSAYIASKHALLGFADVLRPEIRPAGIHVCLVMPATIDTPIYQHTANFTGHKMRPLPPIAAAERVARAIVRLASRPRARVIVGRTQAMTIPLQRIARPLVDRLQRAAIQRISMRDQPADPTLGTLFKPDPASNAISGGWK